MDIKTWLEQAGEPVAETAFPPGEDVPEMPYIVYLDDSERGGGDMKNLSRNHSLSVERYSETSEDNKMLEALLDTQAIKYTKEKQWLTDEECFMTVYNFDILEREVI
ncbi:hypothetical protein [Caproicibacter fermentans]|uniref:Uncharacterized protein n=1 Tax=Caproicibacter fermentans TaxID=2576756 RepID=A0A7G8TDY3_9FIRM|nr:hypothetical protein [Caproicibacter fermentans]QNK41824.1 hypothetical protein HCR03_06165 [Caproicibacter fermentans]